MKINKIIPLVFVLITILSVVPCTAQQGLFFDLKKDSCENEQKFVLSITNNTNNKIYFNRPDITRRIRKEKKDNDNRWINKELNNDQPYPKCNLKQQRSKIPEEFLPRIKEIKDSLTSYLAERKIHFDRDVTASITESLIFLDIGETFIVEDVANSKVHPKGSYDVCYYHRLGGWGQVVGERKTYKLSTPKSINGYLKFEGKVKSKRVEFDL